MITDSLNSLKVNIEEDAIFPIFNIFELDKERITNEDPLKFKIFKEGRIIYSGRVEKSKNGFLTTKMYYSFF